MANSSTIELVSTPARTLPAVLHFAFVDADGAPVDVAAYAAEWATLTVGPHALVPVAPGVLGIRLEAAEVAQLKGAPWDLRVTPGPGVPTAIWASGVVTLATHFADGVPAADEPQRWTGRFRVVDGAPVAFLGDVVRGPQGDVSPAAQAILDAAAQVVADAALALPAAVAAGVVAVETASTATIEAATATGLGALEAKRTGSLGDVEAARSGAVQSVETKRAASVQSVEDKRVSSVAAVTSEGDTQAARVLALGPAASSAASGASLSAAWAREITQSLTGTITRDGQGRVSGVGGPGTAQPGTYRDGSAGTLVLTRDAAGRVTQAVYTHALSGKTITETITRDGSGRATATAVAVTP